ncbi:MAG: hypothetical protein LBF36_00880, partial [Mycoplasmataceae bacterium]|nr:hypothetical protein [Mycoplasmataceae bacterium]
MKRISLIKTISAIGIVGITGIMLSTTLTSCNESNTTITLDQLKVGDILYGAKVDFTGIKEED